MQIIKDALFTLVAEGRVTLQVPGYGIGKQIEYEEIPNDWLCRLSGHDLCTGKKGGCFFLTKKGFEANKDKLKEKFMYAITHGRDRGETWEDFETHAEEHYRKVQSRRDALIKNCKDKITALEQATI